MAKLLHLAKTRILFQAIVAAELSWHERKAAKVTVVFSQSLPDDQPQYTLSVLGVFLYCDWPFTSLQLPLQIMLCMTIW
jgi:hypothetical protein